MKKCVVSLLLVLCMVSTFFVGCKMYTANSDKINNEVAIRVGDEVITREELKNAYSYYYNTIYRYYYAEGQDLLDFTIRELVKQKLGAQVAKQTIVITEEDFEDVLNSVKDSINEDLDEYETKIIEANGDEVPARLKDEEKKDESTPFSEYSPAYINEKPTGEVAISEERKAELVDAFVENLWADARQYSTRLDALNEYIAGLVQSNMVSGDTTDKEETLNKRIDKLVESYLDSKYIEKLKADVKADITFTDNEIIDKFNELVDKEIQAYAGGTFADSFDVASNKNLYLYYGYSNEDEDGNETEQNGYIFVQHLLIQFSDEVQAELAKLPGYGIGEKQYRYYVGQAWLLAGHSQDDPDTPAYAWFPETDEEKNTAAAYMPYEDWLEYKNLRESYIAGLSTTYLDPETGKKVVDEQGNELTKTYAEVVAEIQAVIDLVAEDGETEVQLEARKAQEFRRLMFIYGADGGMFSVGTTTEVMGYILPEDQSKLSNSLNSNKNGFVGEFVVGAYELYNSGELISGQAVFSDYGVHIMINLGSTTPGPVCEATIDAMKSTLLSKSYGETVYDYVATKLFEEKNATAYDEYLDSQKDEIGVEYFIDSYDKL